MEYCEAILKGLQGGGAQFKPSEILPQLNLGARSKYYLNIIYFVEGKKLVTFTV